MNWFRLKACIKCQGDLAADNGDWLCLQCGTYYYTGLYQPHPHLDEGPRVSNPDVSQQPPKKVLDGVTGPVIPAPQTPGPISPDPNSIFVAEMIEAVAL